MPKVLLGIVSLLLIVGVMVGLKQYQGKRYVLGLATTRNLELQRYMSQLNSQVKYWEQVASASPTYREAYIQLADLNYQLNNLEDAKKWMGKTLEVDPNWVIPSHLQSLLP